MDALERHLRLILEPRPTINLRRLAERLERVTLESGHVRQSWYDAQLQLHEHQADQIRRLLRRIAELEQATRELPSPD